MIAGVRSLRTPATLFEPLRLDPDLFGQVKVDEELGTITWPNGADLVPDALRDPRLWTSPAPARSSMTSMT